MRLPAILAAVSATAAAGDYEATMPPLFRATCMSCHSGQGGQGGLDLSTIESAVRGGKTGPALKPGASADSLLVAKIVSGQMPPGGRIEPTQVAAIRDWIDRLAPPRAAVTEADVTPIFQMRCVSCHGKRKQEGGLDLRTQAARLKGGRSGPAIVPGRPEESLILKRISAGEMPPPRLLFTAFVRPPSSPEVETLRAWIAAGCPPAPEVPVSEERFTREQLDWWAFQPPLRPETPRVRGATRNPIDAFLLEKLEAKGLTFAPEAGRLTLMRRAYADLTGLIPTAEEVREFLEDRRPDAYERLVDRLLESPHYGERWARIWMDLAGYADSEGIIDEDRLRPQAWRYRDALIRAFNADMPYDAFLTEQITGDEIADYRRIGSPSQRDIDRLALTGFLRMTPDGTYSPANGSVAERMNVIADEIEVLSSTVLGLTVGCARCHDHKYDPIPQRDYYRLAAILQTSYDPYDWVKPTERNLDIAQAAEKEAAERNNAPLEAEIQRQEKAIADKTAEYRARKGNQETSADDLAKEFPDFKTFLDASRKAIADLNRKLAPKPQIRALYDMGGEPSPVFLLKRGDAQMLGERVQSSTLSVLGRGRLAPYQVEPPWEGTSGRRLALARWLTQPDHPLTARVMVNRLWRHHFGQGIVPTTANFGKTGAAPSHPKLLDWLAREFVSSRWSIKAMHRLMMTSAAYRQSSQAGAAALQTDPDNVLLSRMRIRRMDAEQLHDSVLRAAGRLSPEQFGPPVPVETRPGGEVVEQVSGERWRRSIYLLQRRTTPVTMLEVFDLPPMSPNCTERAQSTVSTQALELRNSAVVLEHARFLAARLIDALPEDLAGQVRELYLRTVSRLPSAEEAERARRSIDTLTRHWQAHLESQKAVAPRAATARWYALGDVAHAMLSSAEFAYVD